MPVTPMLKQYWQIRQQFDDPNTILFFRLGDFYEMFFEDAEVASRLLDITLTSRNRNDPNPIPLCGVPYHAADGYIGKLLAHGKKVAICEQVEDPRLATGIVRREVTRLITPGAVLSEESLPAREGNYLCAVHGSQGKFGLALLDLSTGDFLATQLGSVKALADEIARDDVREVLISRAWQQSGLPPELNVALQGRALTPVEPAEFDPARVPAIDGVVRISTEAAAALPAVAAVWSYVSFTQRGVGTLADHIRAVRTYHAADYLIVDDVAKRNLELTRTMVEGSKQGSLLYLLDRTATAMGARRIKSWLLSPLRDRELIEERLGAVEQFVRDPAMLQTVSDLLKRVGDIERIVGRIVVGDASPRDCVSLGNSLEILPGLTGALAGADDIFKSAREEVAVNQPHSGGEGGTQQALPVGGATRAPAIDRLEDVRGDIGAMLVDDPPVSPREGGLIRECAIAELDELRKIQSDGKGFIARLETSERERTGIHSLKVRYNRVFGYYIEVTHTHLEKIPPDYIRKQTLANAERYITPELKEYEEKVLTATERIAQLEYQAFVALRERLARASARLKKTAKWVSKIDAIASLAAVAQANNYCRPKIVDESVLRIVDGRHPVVEQLSAERFVPNDVELEGMMVITGPNMAGKSTVMRQTALIVLMAHMGSFVPAKEAVIGLTDRIFTRVGAADNLTRGQSTFMVEMSEAATILKEATSRSLIVIDEIGRGTSTFDGVAIAWAVAEHIHDHVRARTLFATHFHELADLALTKERVKNFTMAVKEWNDQIVFLRKLVPGAVNHSYGIQVAKLAGLPDTVIERARVVLSELEDADSARQTGPQLSFFHCK